MEEADRKRKHSVLFRIVAGCATIAVLGILLTRLITNNPLDGEWESPEKQLYVTFSGDQIYITGGETADEEISLRFSYVMEKEMKLIRLTLLEGSKEDLLLVTDQIFSDYNMEGSLKTMDTQFEYSVQGNQLTLMERDYGDTLVLTRK